MQVILNLTCFKDDLNDLMEHNKEVCVFVTTPSWSRGKGSNIKLDEEYEEST